jgi:micrococcal nuclease
MILAAALALSCVVIDGDTIRCGDERIRLSGIDAPETSACRPGRRCVEGDGQASRRALAALIDGKRFTIRRLGKDRWGRTIASLYVGGKNVACSMLASGQAVYVAKWDDLGVVKRDCRL